MVGAIGSKGEARYFSKIMDGSWDSAFGESGGRLGFPICSAALSWVWEWCSLWLRPGPYWYRFTGLLMGGLDLDVALRLDMRF